MPHRIKTVSEASSSLLTRTLPHAGRGVVIAWSFMTSVR